MTFFELYLARKIPAGAIADYVDKWHEDPHGMELHEFLGMSPEQYAVWLRHPGALPKLRWVHEEAAGLIKGWFEYVRTSTDVEGVAEIVGTTNLDDAQLVLEEAERLLKKL